MTNTNELKDGAVLSNELRANKVSSDYFMDGAAQAELIESQYRETVEVMTRLHDDAHKLAAEYGGKEPGKYDVALGMAEGFASNLLEAKIRLALHIGSQINGQGIHAAADDFLRYAERSRAASVQPSEANCA